MPFVYSDVIADPKVAEIFFRVFCFLTEAL